MRDVMHLTMPQIIMMAHAAHVNSARMEERLGRSDNAPRYNYSDYNQAESFAENERLISDGAKKRPYDAAIGAAHDSSKIVGHDPQITHNKTLSDVASDFDVLARYLSDWSI